MRQTVCTVGDAILLERLSPDYDLTSIRALLMQADTRLFNLENVLSDGAPYGSSYCGGTWLLAEESTLDDTLRFGFNGCSFANNHTMDFSYDGLFDTLAAAKKRGLPICGAGKDLEEASAPALIETPNGTCALISISATFNDAARAGYGAEGLSGRPGLNPLRFSTEYHVSPAHMAALREISAATHIDGRRNRSRLGGYTPMPPQGCFGFGEYTFRESEEEGKHTRVNAVDMERTERTVREAASRYGTVIVNVHSHEIKRDTDDEPDDFLVEFCRKCIDAGASAVIGTGTHQLKAIELYRGKPVFYSLGNFIFQSDRVSRMPDDFREKYKLPRGLTPKEQVAARASRGNGGLHGDVNNFRSVMPFMTFEDGVLTGLTLHLLRLDMHTGLPAPADREEQRIIYEYLCERSRPFGTALLLKDGRIEVVFNQP